MEHYIQLVNKKITGEISPLEEIEFQNWLRESPENELFFRRLRDAWQHDQFSVRIKGQQTTFDRISRKIDFEENIYSHESYNPSTKYWRRWHGVAAIFIFLFSAIGFFYFKNSTPNVVEEVVPHEMILKNNPAGQKTRISLPDGSVCWLNSESEITFLANFSDSSRELHLKGEAYFEVARDQERPFRVHSSAMTITALGTIFNVNSFPERHNESVVLLEGKISVLCKDAFYEEVLPGESIGYHKQSNSSDKLNINPEEAMAWKDGVLIFNEESYTTIFDKLERWYGVNIVTSRSPPIQNKYKARFKNELLTNVLESMRYGHEFDFNIDGKNVKIMFNQNTQYDKHKD